MLMGYDMHSGSLFEIIDKHGIGHWMTKSTYSRTSYNAVQSFHHIRSILLH